MNTLPAITRVHGAIVYREERPPESYCTLQFATQKEEWNEVRIPFLDAMYLLELLRTIERENPFSPGPAGNWLSK